ncbi:RIP metalloprotease RseP [Marinococcus halophilus]|uniref:RIP metalloprotease RseP n=1 Tax=Marinococcus halophilus TaxID=1371 RepID=UPI0009A70A25|nr:RIP metalloprotease RseP [Marinococcus halophilus]
MDTLIAVIIMFGLLVAIHEWGHLYFAKKVGILCQEFAIGFGPKIFSTKRNETVYTIRLLPLGGYVRMAGDDPDPVNIKPGYEIGLTFNDAGKVKEIIVNNKSKHPEAKVVSVESIDMERELYIEAVEDEEDSGLKRYEIDRTCDLIVDEKREQIAPWDRQFGSKRPWKKAVAIFAGPFMNFVLAFVLFGIYALAHGVPQDTPVIGGIADGSPLSESAFEEGDVITSVDGESVNSWDEMTGVVQERPGEEVTVTAERGGETIEDTVTIDGVPVQEGSSEEFGQIGVYAELERSFTGALEYGGTQLYEVSTLIFQTLGTIVTGEFSLDDLAGPVGIYDATDQVIATGLLTLIAWSAMISVNLGIVNLLPLPALDGGRLLFIIAEAIRGKPIEPQKEGVIHLLGFALLLLLMIAVTWNDINRLFT